MTGVLAVLDAAGTPPGGWNAAVAVLSMAFGPGALAVTGMAVAAVVARVKARRRG